MGTHAAATASAQRAPHRRVSLDSARSSEGGRGCAQKSSRGVWHTAQIQLLGHPLCFDYMRAVDKNEYGIRMCTCSHISILIKSHHIRRARHHILSIVGHRSIWPRTITVIRLDLQLE